MWCSLVLYWNEISRMHSPKHFHPEKNFSLLKKWSFPLWICSVNVTRSAGTFWTMFAPVWVSCTYTNTGTLLFIKGLFHRCISFLENISEAVVQRCFIKKVFSKILQNLLKNTCVGVISVEFCNTFQGTSV